MMSWVPSPPEYVATSSLIRMITRRPFGGAPSRYLAATKMPSLIFVAPPTLKSLISLAISLLSLVNGTRSCASVEKVNSATSSSGFSAAGAVFAQLKILFFQVAQDLPGLGLHRGVHHHQVHRHPHRWRLLLLRRHYEW